MYRFTALITGCKLWQPFRFEKGNILTLLAINTIHLFFCPTLRVRVSQYANFHRFMTFTQVSGRQTLTLKAVKHVDARNGNLS